MPLSYLIYCSTLFDEFVTVSQLELLVEQAQKRNEFFGVTGFLHLQDLEVLQYLEGESAHLSGIKKSIFKDPRHRRIVLIAEGEAISRRFPDWAMGMSSRETVAPLRIPPLGLAHEEYILFLEVAAARTRRNAKQEQLYPRQDGS